MGGKFWTYAKWTVRIVLLLLVAGFLHYTLPQHDIVRIVGTENRRVDIGENSIFWSRAEVGMTNSTSRDVFFINAVYPNGSTMEYRNEDTGTGWPPYFKIDSFGLQTQAKELASTQDKPIWVSVTHYGWRNKFFTIFPNAVEVRQVASPDTTIIPWVNIVVLVLLLFVVIMIRRMWAQFWERTVEPAAANVEEAWDGVENRAGGIWGRIKGWFSRKK